MPPEDINLIAKRLPDAGVRHELITDPNTPRGFFCHERDTYREQPAEDAWARVRDLLAAELSP